MALASGYALVYVGGGGRPPWVFDRKQSFVETSGEMTMGMFTFAASGSLVRSTAI